MVVADDQRIIQTAKQFLQSQQERSAAPSSIVEIKKNEDLVVSGLSGEKELEIYKKRQEISQSDKRFEAEMDQRKMDRDLKKRIANQVFGFLGIETIALFLVILIQGFRPYGFHLEDSTINIFLGATLLQISSMAVIITRHLYPTSA